MPTTLTGPVTLILAGKSFNEVMVLGVICPGNPSLGNVFSQLTGAINSTMYEHSAKSNAAL